MIPTIIIGLIKTLSATLLMVFIPVNLLIGGFSSIGLTSLVDITIDLLAKVNLIFIWLFGHPVWSAFVLTAILTLFGLPIVQLSYHIAHFVKNVKGFIK